MELEYRELSRIFNSNVLADVADGDLMYVHKMIQKFFPYDNSLTLEEFYNHSFDILKKKYTNEYVYKNLIANKILLGRHSLNTATMLSEFRVGINKADCVILNGKSTCYEIKTEYDSLVRLNDQLDAYTQVFDEVYVVCSFKHLESILSSIDPVVGILVLSDKMSFSEIRKATRLTKKNVNLMMQSMRQKEYVTLCETLIGKKILAPNTQLFDVCCREIEKFSNEKLFNDIYIKILKKYRANNRSFILGVPSCLLNAAISYKFTKTQINSLIDTFNTKELINVLSNSKGET